MEQKFHFLCVVSGVAAGGCVNSRREENQLRSFLTPFELSPSSLLCARRSSPALKKDSRAFVRSYCPHYSHCPTLTRQSWRSQPFATLPQGRAKEASPGGSCRHRRLMRVSRYLRCGRCGCTITRESFFERAWSASGASQGKRESSRGAKTCGV